MPVSDYERTVLDRIDAGWVTDLTVALLQAVGQNPPGEEAATVATLAAAAADLGLHVTETAVEPHRNNLRVTLGAAPGPGLLLLGHTDVVPIGDGWSTDPFGGAVADGRIFGRGASDMKGGLAACLAALAALRGEELSGPVELAALVDEEDTGKGIRAYVDTVCGRFLGCITAEPTELQTIIAARGDSTVRVEIRGRACHAGNPTDGANAIYGAAAVVAEIENLQAELATSPHALLGPATWSVGQIVGGSGASTVASDCVLVADRRLLPGESPQEVLDDLTRRISALGLADRGLTAQASMPMEMPPFETPADCPLVLVADAALTDAGGPRLPLAGWTAACDGGFVARDLGVPVVVLGPGSVTEQAHRPDESVDVEDLLTAARAYTLTCLRLLGRGG